MKYKTINLTDINGVTHIFSLDSFLSMHLDNGIYRIEVMGFGTFKVREEGNQEGLMEIANWLIVRGI